MDTNPVARNLKNNLRQLREARGLTQEQLSRLSGIPRATWANLESGTANPTVSVLVKVAAALQVPVEELIGAPRATTEFYPAASIPSRKRGEAVVRRLLPDTLRSVELDRMEIAAGGRMIGAPHRTGTREYLTCERGRIELTVAEERWTLGPGDVVVFRGDQRHSYRNPGDEAAVGYSIILFS